MLKKQWIISCLLWLGTAIAVGSIATLFADPYYKSNQFWFWSIVFIIVPVIAGICSLIQTWAAYFLYTKTLFQRSHLRFLSKSKMPYADCPLSVSEYLGDIMNNDESSLELKLIAAKTMGEMAAMNQMHPFTLGAQMEMSFFAALWEWNDARSKK